MFKPTRSWREELNGYCQCFPVTCIANKFQISSEKCPDPNKCPASSLRQIFDTLDQPKQPELIKAMVVTHTFTYKQLVGSLQELFQLDAQIAQVRVSTILRGIVKKEPKMKLTKDDTGRYVLIKRRK